MTGWLIVGLFVITTSGVMLAIEWLFRHGVWRDG